MPELPEVEVSRQGILPFLEQQKVKRVICHRASLRWPIPPEVQQLEGQVINRVSRRAKYILISSNVGSLILHLGMSGNLRVLPEGSPLQKHDHFELLTAHKQSLRLYDPRRFGAVLWQPVGEIHPLLANLGPEPLTDDFHAHYLYQAARGRRVAVKNFIMDNKVVVGVGNIYANEALFMSGIQPSRQAGKISQSRYLALTQAIKKVLAEAIEQGGTTLKDFSRADGQPGYFAQELAVYGRAGQPCIKCKKPLKALVIGQRQSVFCAQCQT